MQKTTIITTPLMSAIALCLMACGQASSTTPDAPPDDARPAPLLQRLARARSAAPSPALSQPDAASSDPPIPAKYAAFAAAFDAERQSLGAPGAAVAILEHGEVAFAHGFGTRGVNSTVAVDARTNFRIGSITKALTAAAFMTTDRDGGLPGGQLLTSLIPDVTLHGSDAAGLTMGQLLSQQSGLFDFINDGSNAKLTVLSCPTGAGALASFVTGRLFGTNEYFMAPPGEVWDYSDTNYILVGAALEKASGEPYASAMSDRVFTPLGMTRTFFDPTQVVADGDYTDGLSTNEDGTPWDVAPTAYDCGWYRPAGYAFSSVEDYAKFLQFLYAGNSAVLGDLLRRVMISGKIDTYVFGDTTSYAYGVETRTGIELASGYYPTPILTHEGAIAGYVAHFILAPATGFGMVILSNADGADFWNSIDLGFKSFSGLPAPVAPPAALDPDPTAPAGFAGTYVDTTGQLGTMVISAADGGLTIQLPLLDDGGVPYTPALQPDNEYDYLLTVQGEQLPLTFAPGLNHRHEWLLINESFLAQRSSPTPAP